MKNKDMGHDLRRLRNQGFALPISASPNHSVPFSVSPTEILLEALCARRHEAIQEFEAIQADLAETETGSFSELQESVLTGGIARTVDEIRQCNNLIDSTAHNLSVMYREAIRFVDVEEHYKAQLTEEYIKNYEPKREQAQLTAQVFHDLQDGYLAMWKDIGDTLVPDHNKVAYPDLLQTMLTRWQQAVELSDEERPTIVEARQVGQLISSLASLQTHYSTIVALQERARNVREKEKAAAMVDAD